MFALVPRELISWLQAVHSVLGEAALKYIRVSDLNRFLA